MNAITQATVAAFQQRGAALIVSLLFLLIMTLIGVTAIQVATLEERMSGNLRSRNLAFQAAETALRVGENVLKTRLESASPPAFDCHEGFYGRWVLNDANCDGASDSSPIWQAVDWSSGNVGLVSLDNVPNPPAYIIEYMYSSLNASVGGDNSLEAGRPKSNFVCYYRITARGTGSTSASVVILQSTYSHSSINNSNNQGDCHA